MSSNELVKDRSAELLSEELKKKLYFFHYLGLAIVFISFGVSMLGFFTDIVARYNYIFVYSIFGPLLDMIARKGLYMKLGKVLKYECDPEKYLEMWERISETPIGRGWLKRYRYDYVYAHVVMEQYDKVEELANKYLTKKSQRMLKLCYLSSAYIKRDNEKFLKCYEEARALEAELALKGEKVTNNELMFKNIQIQKCMLDKDLEGAKVLVMQILDVDPVRIAPISRCFMNINLGDIEYELGNKLDATICYNDAYEIGPKLKRVQRMLPRLEELKASYGGKKD